MSIQEFVDVLYHRAAQVLHGQLSLKNLITPSMLEELLGLVQIESFDLPSLPIARISELSSAAVRNTARAAFIGEMFGVAALTNEDFQLLDESDMKARRAILAALVLGAQHVELAFSTSEPDQLISLAAEQFSSEIGGNVLRWVAEEGELAGDHSAAASGYRNNKAHVKESPDDWLAAIQRLRQIVNDQFHGED